MNTYKRTFRRVKQAALSGLVGILMAGASLAGDNFVIGGGNVENLRNGTGVLSTKEQLDIVAYSILNDSTQGRTEQTDLLQTILDTPIKEYTTKDKITAYYSTKKMGYKFMILDKYNNKISEEEKGYYQVHDEALIFSWEPGQFAPGDYTFLWYREGEKSKLAQVERKRIKPDTMFAQTTDAQQQADNLEKKVINGKVGKRVKDYSGLISVDDQLHIISDDKNTNLLENKNVGMYSIRKRIVFDSKIAKEDVFIKKKVKKREDEPDLFIFQNKVLGYYFAFIPE